MQPLKTTSDVRTGSTETGYNSFDGTLDVNATVETLVDYLRERMRYLVGWDNIYNGLTVEPELNAACEMIGYAIEELEGWPCGLPGPTDMAHLHSLHELWEVHPCAQ